MTARKADSTWNASLSEMTASGSVGKKISDWVLGSDNKAILSTGVHTGAVIPEVTTVTGNVSGSVGSVTTGVSLADGAESAIATAVWSNSARVLTAGTNIGFPTIANIVDSGNANGWNAVTSTTGLALTTDVTTARDAIIASGQANWVTATGFATPTNITAGTITTVTNLTNLPVTAATLANQTAISDQIASLNNLSIDTVVASGNANGWNSTNTVSGIASDVWTYGSRVLTADTNINYPDLGDIYGYDIDGVPMSGVMSKLEAHVAGQINKSGSSYQYMKPDNVTLAYTLTESGNYRLVS